MENNTRKSIQFFFGRIVSNPWLGAFAEVQRIALGRMALVLFASRSRVRPDRARCVLSCAAYTREFSRSLLRQGKALPANVYVIGVSPESRVIVG